MDVPQDEQSSVSVTMSAWRFYKLPISFYVRLLPVALFFFLGTLEAPNKEKLLGHATYIFMLTP